MKRHPSLVPLSHDHHHTLVRARVSQLGVGSAVARVLEWALAARPTDRIATAPEMLGALKAAANIPPSYRARTRSEPPTVDAVTARDEARRPGSRASRASRPAPCSTRAI